MRGASSHADFIQNYFLRKRMFRKMQMMTLAMTMMTMPMMMMTLPMMMMTKPMMMMTMIGPVSGADSAPDWRLALS